MLAKRIIPCLDVTDGRVVKGVNFVDLRDAGDPVDCAVAYNEQEADEIVFLDITASSDERNTMVEVVRRTAERCFVPLTVGGGIREVEDMRKMLYAGADKVGEYHRDQSPEVVDEGAGTLGARRLWSRSTLSSKARQIENLYRRPQSRGGARCISGPAKCIIGGRVRSCLPAWMRMGPKKATILS